LLDSKSAAFCAPDNGNFKVEFDRLISTIITAIIGVADSAILVFHFPPIGAAYAQVMRVRPFDMEASFGSLRSRIEKLQCRELNTKQ